MSILDGVTMCMASDIIGGPDCLRVARWQWQPDGPGTHPVFLCNFHAEPLTVDQIAADSARRPE